jgi:hypothetical protein
LKYSRASHQNYFETLPVSFSTTTPSHPFPKIGLPGNGAAGDENQSLIGALIAF